ncbi:MULTISPECIES: LPXTG cell wall anchor domain-containing protein [Microbacterium]|uniref:Uncharacterized protein n=1 Tax=Microbacterium maritypicum MF109 TaxID=1333857 RepID=T5KKG5_MICMQ|nr:MULTISPECIES: LPXTG cell wall anchor domain-containing protein [Microbacterium]EQM75766.1 hypothetical protein L687_01650 [Microbacterium maritypicum MF109]MCV0335967.1 LPXTG cell wall anchor domain-containing protein [Microbacterium sp.]MCV0377204.1 LPXTG cell wall anchor domain-containing protein [Microbacterium sp.]MCV0390815.1 LPXTG cell wall anchor domain-containing protein [Microbacterium sp.]MCV0419634.1 LPXTG cell wall anchor domain-containing protein [Microbacterium sp.]
MYSSEVSAPVAVVGVLAMTGPDSVIVWAVLGAVAVGAGAFLVWRRHLLRVVAPESREPHDRCR